MVGHGTTPYMVSISDGVKLKLLNWCMHACKSEN